MNIFYNNLYNRVEPRYKPAEMYVAGLGMRTTRQQLEPRWISIKSIIIYFRLYSQGGSHSDEVVVSLGNHSVNETGTVSLLW